jgi:Fe-S oxidoreductase
MKILLAAINAKYIHSNLAVRNIKNYALEYKDEIDIGEYTINQSIDFILKEIYKQNPEILALSCYIWNINYVKELIKEVAKILPNTKIWLGGPEVSYEADIQIQEMPEITGIMLGEGESIFYNLLHYYHGKITNLSSISGLVYRETKMIQSSKIQVTGAALQIDLDTIPFGYDKNDIKQLENRIIYYESSRGCPFSCSYCLSSIEKGVRFRDTETVLREIAFFMDNKVPQVKFVDRTFNCNHRHSIEIWKFISENDNGITNFHFEISADLITDEELEILKTLRQGLVQFEVGIQSTNELTINEIRRTMKLSRLYEVVRKINSWGNIHLHLDLIVGLPFEDYESFGKSFDCVYALEPEQMQIGFLKVLKGSYMYEMACEYDIKYKNSAPYEILSNKWVSYDEVLRLKDIESITELYYNSTQYVNTLNEMLIYFKSAFKMYESIADYYEINGFFEKSYNRIGKYELLYYFIVDSLPKHLHEKLRNCLIYDLYLREKVKSRPNFAPDMSGYKEKFKYFFMKEEKERQYLKGYEDYNSRQISNMAHIEVFEENKEKYYILFDYKNKNLITKNCKTIKIDI